MEIQTKTGFTATQIDENISPSGAHQKTYKIDPPLKLDGGEVTEYVLVSAVVAYSGPETYIFPCNEQGEVISWDELPGSFQGSLDHEAALQEINHEL